MQSLRVRRRPIEKPAISDKLAIVFDDPFGYTQLGKGWTQPPQPASVCEALTQKRNAPGLSDEVYQIIHMAILP